jgi:hypothetical protein
MNYQNVLTVLGIGSIIFTTFSAIENAIRSDSDEPCSYRNAFIGFTVSVICFALAAGMRKG